MLNGTEYFYIRNAQNDIIGILDATGTQVVKYTYDSWGKVISTTGTKATTVGKLNPYRYRGYRYDEETGFYYLQSRYYNPSWGRFINADGLTSTGQGVIGNNMFAYCLNNPVNMEDSDGDLAIVVSMGIGAGIGALISGGLNIADQLTSNNSFSWKSLGVALIGGAASGALTGSGIGIVGAVTGNMAISAGSYLATCGREFSWGKLALNTVVGGLSGAWGGKGAFNAVEHALKKAQVAIINYSFGHMKKLASDAVLKSSTNIIARTAIENINKTSIAGGLSIAANRIYDSFFGKSITYGGGGHSTYMAY